MNILFVCTGNTCRSPMAESILRAKAPHISVQSAGTTTVSNTDVNPLTERMLATHDLESDHRSQQVDQSLLKWADLILTMTTQHKQSLMIDYPDYQEKLFTLKEYVNSADKEVSDELHRSETQWPDDEVSDPFGGDIDVYERTFAELDASMDRLVAIINAN